MVSLFDLISGVTANDPGLGLFLAQADGPWKVIMWVAVAVLILLGVFVLRYDVTTGECAIETSAFGGYIGEGINLCHL